MKKKVMIVIILLIVFVIAYGGTYIVELFNLRKGTLEDLYQDFIIDNPPISITYSSNPSGKRTTIKNDKLEELINYFLKLSIHSAFPQNRFDRDFFASINLTNKKGQYIRIDLVDSSLIIVHPYGENASAHVYELDEILDLEYIENCFEED